MTKISVSSMVIVITGIILPRTVQKNSKTIMTLTTACYSIYCKALIRVYCMCILQYTLYSILYSV